MKQLSSIEAAIMNFPEKKALMEYLSRIGTYVMGLMDEDVTNTYRDYLSWNGREQWEIIRGRACHENAYKSELAAALRLMLIQRFSSYFNANRDSVRSFPEILTLAHDPHNESSIINAVSPDLSLFLPGNQSGLNRSDPVPDIIIEIADRDNAYHLFKKKHDLYQEFGIPQYWIADPERCVLFRHCLDTSGAYGKVDIYSEIDDLSLEKSSLASIAMESLSLFTDEHRHRVMALLAPSENR